MLSSFRKPLTAFALLAVLSLCACSKAAAGPDPQKLAALKEALKNGILTQQEYDAKVAQLTADAAPSSSSGSTSSSKDSSSKDSKEMTTVAVVDPVFNMPAFTVTLPKNWTFEGAVLRGSCGDGGPMYVYRASSPDGLTGMQSMPRVDWYYAQDPRAIKTLGWSTCNLHQPVPASQQINDIAAKARPNPQIGPIDKPPSPNLDEAMTKSNQMFDRQSQANGRPHDGSHVSGEVARVHLHYDFQGHAEEENFSVTTEVWDMGVSVVGSGRNGILQPQWVRAQHTQIFAYSNRAPAGKLESSLPLLVEIGNSVKLVPEYEQAFQAMQQRNFQAAMQASNAAFQAIHQQGEANMQAMQQRHSEYMQWQNQRSQAQNQQFQSDMARKDSQHQNFMDYVQDQQYYQNPETGATVTVRNVPGATGVITPSTVNGSWVQLAPISH